MNRNSPQWKDWNRSKDSRPSWQSFLNESTIKSIRWNNRFLLNLLKFKLEVGVLIKEKRGNAGNGAKGHSWIDCAIHRRSIFYLYFLLLSLSLSVSLSLFSLSTLISFRGRRRLITRLWTFSPFPIKRHRSIASQAFFLLVVALGFLLFCSFSIDGLVFFDLIASIGLTWIYSRCLAWLVPV